MNGSIITSIFKAIPLWVMLMPILTCSVIFVAILIERTFFYKSTSGADYRRLLEKIMRANAAGTGNSTDLEGHQGPVADFVRQCLSTDPQSDEGSLAIKDAAEKSQRRIERYAGVVSTIATISPMFGLLGTVTGMMKSFAGLSESGPSAYSLLAGGITEALVTTALGLMVAIPALIFYNYMVTKIDLLLRDVEFIANAFLEK